MISNYKNLMFKSSYVNGVWDHKTSVGSFDVINPATQETLQTLSDGGDDIVKQAITAANTAFESWRSLLAKERATYMEKWWSVVLEHKDALATLMTLESGKPLKESRSEVEYAASFIKWFAEEARRANGAVIPTFSKENRVVTLKQPIGVVGAITPWNFPLAMITRKISPAFASGCTVVARPAAETPLSALALAHLAEVAGFPKGVFNVVVGKDAASMGKILCESPIVRKISFTGSTKVGALLMEQSAPSIKKLSLELGGNAPFIIFEDADIDAAVNGAVNSKFRNAGQTCVCVNRFIVHEKIYNEFAEKLVQRVKTLKCGNGLEDSTDIGPLINAKAIKNVESFIDDAKQNGGEILCGGQKIKDQFFSPTVIGNANSKMKLAQEEIFGPVAPLFKFSKDEEAIQMANDTIYGLASYIYTRDVGRCWKVSEALEYGIVGINEGLISTEVAPFGGVKSSGLGREGSIYGLDDYLELKYLCFGGIKN